MGIETPITDRIGQGHGSWSFQMRSVVRSRCWPAVGMPCYVAAMEAPEAETQRVFAPGILRDQVAIVTGGGSGIGLATAHEMVRLGARVAICGRAPPQLDAAAVPPPPAGGPVLARAGDIRAPAPGQGFAAQGIGG